MEAMAQRLLEAIKKSPAKLSGLRVFVIGENHFFRIINEKYMWTGYSEEFGYADIAKLERGKILAAFAKLEFLVNECINLHILSAESSKFGNLSLLVRKLPFRQRIEALKEFGLIGASFEKKLKKLVTTRNILAHEWDEKVATFGNKPLKSSEVFDSFRAHLKSSFEKLVAEYKKLQEETDYKSYLLNLVGQIEAKDTERKTLTKSSSCPASPNCWDSTGR